MDQTKESVQNMTDQFCGPKQRRCFVQSHLLMNENLKVRVEHHKRVPDYPMEAWASDKMFKEEVLQKHHEDYREEFRKQRLARKTMLSEDRHRTNWLEFPDQQPSESMFRGTEYVNQGEEDDPYPNRINYPSYICCIAFLSVSS